MFERELLLWPGVVLAALAALELLSGGRKRAHFWGYDLLGGAGVAGGGLLLNESQRSDAPFEIELGDLFSGVFDGWPQALLVAVIAAAILLVVTIIIGRSLPSWQRALAQSAGVIGVLVLSHLWSVGL